MTQVWRGDEKIAVTKVQAGPCVITQVKDDKKDGYSAVQLGYGEKKEKNIKKPQRNHLKGLGNLRYLREFRIDSGKGDLKRGDKIDVSTFEIGDIIDVIGTSKGKGFQGVVKRHGFGGQKKTHGTKDQLRSSGSIGSKGPAHVFKGVRMGGRMGGVQKTMKNLEVIEVDKENNILFIMGGVPGARNSLLEIKGEGELKTISNEQLAINNKKEEEVKTEEKVEAVAEVVETPAGEVKNEEVKEEEKKEEIKN